MPAKHFNRIFISDIFHHRKNFVNVTEHLLHRIKLQITPNIETQEIYYHSCTIEIEKNIITAINIQCILLNVLPNMNVIEIYKYTDIVKLKILSS